MFINNINDEDLCKLLYKASVGLFPNYKYMFNDDLEEFQQMCAYLMLKQLKKYNSDKGAISTYIYTHMPLVLGVWIRQHEAKIMLFENRKLDINTLLNDTDLEEEEIENSIYVSDYDLKQYIINKEEHKKFLDILKKYPYVEKKILNDYTFNQLGKELGVSTRTAKYMFYKDIQKMLEKDKKLLKSLSLF